MIRRSTLIILFVFIAVLAGGLYFQKYQSNKQAQVTPTPEINVLFPGVTKDQVTGLEIDDNQGKKLVIAQDPSGSWVVTGFSAADTDPTGIDSMLNQVTSLSILSDLENPPALDVVGLTTPAYIFHITLQDGQQKTLNIGTLTPTKSGYYARLGENNPIVVSKYAVDNIMKLLVNPPIATPIPTVVATDMIGATPTPQP